MNNSNLENSSECKNGKSNVIYGAFDIVEREKIADYVRECYPCSFNSPDQKKKAKNFINDILSDPVIRGRIIVYLKLNNLYEDTAGSDQEVIKNFFAKNYYLIPEYLGIDEHEINKHDKKTILTSEQFHEVSKNDLKYSDIIAKDKKEKTIFFDECVDIDDKTFCHLALCFFEKCIPLKSLIDKTSCKAKIILYYILFIKILRDRDKKGFHELLDNYIDHLSSIDSDSRIKEGLELDVLNSYRDAPIGSQSNVYIKLFFHMFSFYYKIEPKIGSEKLYLKNNREIFNEIFNKSNDNTPFIYKRKELLLLKNRFLSYEIFLGTSLRDMQESHKNPNYNFYNEYIRDIRNDMKVLDRLYDTVKRNKEEGKTGSFDKLDDLISSISQKIFYKIFFFYKEFSLQVEEKTDVEKIKLLNGFHISEAHNTAEKHYINFRLFLCYFSVTLDIESLVLNPDKKNSSILDSIFSKDKDSSIFSDFEFLKNNYSMSEDLKTCIAQKVSFCIKEKYEIKNYDHAMCEINNYLSKEQKNEIIEKIGKTENNSIIEKLDNLINMNNSLETSNSGNNNGMNNNDSESNLTNPDAVDKISYVSEQLDVILHGQAISGIAEFFGIKNKKRDEDVIKIIKEVGQEVDLSIFSERTIDGVTSYLIGEGYQSSDYIKEFVRKTYKKILKKLNPSSNRSEKEFIDFLDQIKFKSQKSVNENLGKKIDDINENLGKKVDETNRKNENLGKKIDDINENLGKKVDETNRKSDEILEAIHRSNLDKTKNR